ncbi:hypothetical protein N781_14830 [Pontibacillus halophilus JSM 076056 = DSM 19796]|uniref:Zincin peptidase n=1 Tax=Pontibacillus halophilus JSM 076056 = DSM 19796 TaxID=1385510 RepID=A0A0A5GMZ9_9BACI|nr:DUF3267 domain-containing protein [Pontibacillus halophilus]KGX92603.1 hypothetical protein N781_14830 [Pontibacillus halophilus JSM 076056 = DSM 19796]
MNLNCWKTVNINKDFGSDRIFMVSFLLGTFSFMFLYVPFSMIHHQPALEDHGLLPLALALFLLPSIHKLTHILPLVLLNKRVRVQWKFKRGFLPTFRYRANSALSKKTSILMALAPTLLLTIPGLIACYVFPNYFAYILLFTCINIGLSFFDFLCVRHFLRAPRKCIIENAKDGYDILIQNTEV